MLVIAATDTATVAAFVAAGVALIVGIASPVITSILANRRLAREQEHDREMRLLDDRIQVIDEATVALRMAWVAADRVKILWQRDMAWNDPAATEARTRLRKAIDGVTAAKTRVELRFGEGALVSQKYAACAFAMDVIAHELAPFAEKEAYAPHESSLDEAKREFTGHRLEYMGAAHAALAGG